MQALPAKFQAVARAYHPLGRCDVTARSAERLAPTQPSQRYTVGFRGDAAVCYDLFPVPLERLAGSINVVLGPAGPNQCTWVCTFNDVRAAFAGARVAIAGQARPDGEGTRVDLTIQGRNVPLNETLAEAFASPRMKLRPIWEMFCPTGRFDFTAEVMHADRQPEPADYDIRVRHTGATIRPTFFPLELDDLSGSFRLTRGTVEVNRYTARHGTTHFDFGGGLVRFGEGWHSADLHGLRADPLAVDAALVAAPAAGIAGRLPGVGTDRHAGGRTRPAGDRSSFRTSGTAATTGVVVGRTKSDSRTPPCTRASPGPA